MRQEDSRCSITSLFNGRVLPDCLRSQELQRGSMIQSLKMPWFHQQCCAASGRINRKNDNCMDEVTTHVGDMTTSQMTRMFRQLSWLWVQQLWTQFSGLVTSKSGLKTPFLVKLCIFPHVYPSCWRSKKKPATTRYKSQRTLGSNWHENPRTFLEKYAFKIIFQMKS